MPKSLNQLFKKKEQQTRKLWETEFSLVEQGLDEKQVIAFVNNLNNQQKNPQKAPIESLRSLINRAVTDAEEIAALIKQKAEEEAVGIIDRAKQGVEGEPKVEAENTTPNKAAQKQAKQEAKRTAKEESKMKTEEIKQAGTPTADVSVLEIKEEESVQPEEVTEVESTLEEAFELIEEETAVPETIEQVKEELPVQLPREEIPAKKRTASTPLPLNKEALYSGEIALGISVPVNPAAVSKLYNYLESTPDLKILYTRGSWDRGTTITVSLDKPLPLIGLISRISGIIISPASTQEENSAKVSSNSLLGANRKEATKIDLVLSVE